MKKGRRKERGAGRGCGGAHMQSRRPRAHCMCPAQTRGGVVATLWVSPPQAVPSCVHRPMSCSCNGARTRLWRTRMRWGVVDCALVWQGNWLPVASKVPRRARSVEAHWHLVGMCVLFESFATIKSQCVHSHAHPRTHSCTHAPRKIDATFAAAWALAHLFFGLSLELLALPALLQQSHPRLAGTAM